MMSIVVLALDVPVQTCEPIRCCGGAPLACGTRTLSVRMVCASCSCAVPRCCNTRQQHSDGLSCHNDMEQLSEQVMRSYEVACCNVDRLSCFCRSYITITTDSQQEMLNTSEASVLAIRIVRDIVRCVRLVYFMKSCDQSVRGWG